MSNANANLKMRNLLYLDAATCIGMGMLLIVGARFVAALTSIPSPLLLYAGTLLLPIGVALSAIARFGHNGSAPILAVAGNALWVAASVALLVGPWISPNALGHALIGGQAAAVAVVATLELSALRGTRAAGVANPA
jgi:hypothetical protein